MKKLFTLLSIFILTMMNGQKLTTSNLDSKANSLVANTIKEKELDKQNEIKYNNYRKSSTYSKDLAWDEIISDEINKRFETLRPLTNLYIQNNDGVKNINILNFYFKF